MSEQPAHLYIDDSQSHNGLRSAVLESPRLGEHALYFQNLDGPFTASEMVDPFVMATLLHSMKNETAVLVHGAVSSRLLRGIEELQGVWTNWVPELYSRVEIVPETVVSDMAKGDSLAVAAFSGGVDSSFTVHRHLLGKARPDRVNLQAVLMVHGFDIPLTDEATFVAARRRATNQLRDLDVNVLSVKTNLRDWGQTWTHVFGLAVASSLSLFQSQFEVGLIGSGAPYRSWQEVPWGSSPITDHLFSTNFMEMRHDGAFASRTEKVAAISGWNAGVEGLRVCWAGEKLDRNCGACEKCLRTYLNFRAAGRDDVPCFDVVPSLEAIRGIKVKNAKQVAELEAISAYAIENGREGEWIDALNVAIGSNRRSTRWRASPSRRLMTAVARRSPAIRRLATRLR